MRIVTERPFWYLCVGLVFFLGGVSPAPHSQAQILTVTRASLTSLGTEGNRKSYNPSITFDGRKVIFASFARNLVSPPKIDALEAVYLRDLVERTTSQLDLSESGDRPDFAQVDLDLPLSTSAPQISRDGRVVAFSSFASNLVANDTNQALDLFVRDLESKKLVRVSTTEGGAQGNGHSFAPRLSGSGRLVLFHSTASNLAPGHSDSSLGLFLRDLDLNTVRVVPKTHGTNYEGVLSADGAQVAHIAVDSLGVRRLLKFFVNTGQTEVLFEGGGIARPAISATGRFVVAEGELPGGPALSKILLFDELSGGPTVISQSVSGGFPNGGSSHPTISDDGKYIAFSSTASDLVTDDDNQSRDIFVYDRDESRMTRISFTTHCEEDQEDFIRPVLSGDGKVLAFVSLDRYVSEDLLGVDGSTLEVADRNGAEDVYLMELDLGPPPEITESLQNPPPQAVVNCRGSVANLILPRFAESDDLAQLAPKERKLTKTHIISVERLDSKGTAVSKKRLTSKRNEVTLRKLPPGSYRATVKTELRRPNGITTSTKTSNPTSFKIERKS